MDPVQHCIHLQSFELVYCDYFYSFFCWFFEIYCVDFAELGKMKNHEKSYLFSDPSQMDPNQEILFNQR